MKTCAHTGCTTGATWRVGPVITCDTHLPAAQRRWPRAEPVALEDQHEGRQP